MDPIGISSLNTHFINPISSKNNFKDKSIQLLKIRVVVLTVLGILAASIALGYSALPALAIQSSLRSIEGAIYALGILQLATAAGLGITSLTIPYLAKDNLKNKSWTNSPMYQTTSHNIKDCFVFLGKSLAISMTGAMSGTSLVLATGLVTNLVNNYILNTLPNNAKYRVR